MTRARSASSKTSMRRRPRSLARNMAASARRSSSSGSRSGSAMARPPLAVTVNSWAPSCTGSSRHRSSAVARATALPSSGQPGSSTMISSPPNRATSSSGPAADRNRSATVMRSRSPAWWPSESLTTLNRSRSMRSTAKAGMSSRRSPSTASPSAIHVAPAVGQAREPVDGRLVGEALLGLVAGEGLAEDAGSGPEHRAVGAVGEDAAEHRGERQEPGEAAVLRHRDGEHAAEALAPHDRDLVVGLGVALEVEVEVGLLEPREAGHRWAAGRRQDQIAFAELDPLGGPLVGEHDAVDRLVHPEHRDPGDRRHRAEHGQGVVHALVEALHREADERGRQRHQPVLVHQPLTQRLLGDRDGAAAAGRDDHGAHAVELGPDEDVGEGVDPAAVGVPEPDRGAGGRAGLREGQLPALEEHLDVLGVQQVRGVLAEELVGPVAEERGGGGAHHGDRPVVVEHGDQVLDVAEQRVDLRGGERRPWHPPIIGRAGRGSEGSRRLGHPCHTPCAHLS